MTPPKTPSQLNSQMLAKNLLQVASDIQGVKTIYQATGIIHSAVMEHIHIPVAGLLSIESDPSGPFVLHTPSPAAPSGALVLLSEDLKSQLIQNTFVDAPKTLTAEPESTRKIFNQLSVQQLVSITHRNKLVGLLLLNGLPDNRDESETIFLEALSKIIAPEICLISTEYELKRSHTSLEKKVFELEAVAETNRALQAGLDLSMICHALLLTVTGHLMSGSGQIYVFSPQEQLFRLITQTGSGDKAPSHKLTLSPETISFITSKEYISPLNNVPDDLSRIMSSLGADICIPMNQKEAVTGICFIGEKATGVPYHQAEKNLASLLMSQGDAPIRNCLLYDKLGDANQVLTDTITRLQAEMEQRINAEHRLLKSETRLRNILDTANEGFLEINDKACIVDVNPEICRIMERSKDDIVGDHIFKHVAPEHQGVLQHQLEMRKSGKRSVYELALVTPTNKTRYCLMKATPIFKDSENPQKTIGSFAMVTDITDRKLTEDQLKTFEQIVSASNDIMMLVDFQYRLLTINTASRNAFELPDAGQLGFSFSDLTGNETFNSEFKNAFDQCLSGEIVRLRLWVDFPAWGKRYMDAALYPDTDTTRDRPRAIIIMRDLTQEKQLETRLHQAHKMEAIGTLAGGIAHDFNNILSGIIGYTTLAQEEVDPESRTKGYLEKVQMASHRAADLIRQILAFSRKDDQEKKPVRPDLIVHEALKLLRATLPATISIVPEINIGKTYILGNTTQIHQVLMNLCTNAAHAMEKTGGTITVSIDNIPLSKKDVDNIPELSRGDYLRIRVQDTGHGIPQEIQNRIFEPFFTTKAPGKGTGMGLAVAHGIIASHNGAVLLESSPSQGTTVDILIPALPHEEPTEAAPQPSRMPRGVEKILFVDDEEILVEMADKLLSGLGYRVTAVSESTEALKLFQSAPDEFDLLITDQTMPNMTGLELAQKIHAIRPDLGVILCSGFSEAVTNQAMEISGISEYILKPLSPTKLAHAIRRALPTPP